MKGRERSLRKHRFNFEIFRLLWIKNLNESIDNCRRQRLLTSMFRAPESSQSFSQPIGQIFIREISTKNLPVFSRDKNHTGNNPYCIIEMNHFQRQTTPVLCEMINYQWNILFRFNIYNIQNDLIKCLIYNRSKYTTDRKENLNKIVFFVNINVCRPSWISGNSIKIIN